MKDEMMAKIMDEVMKKMGGTEAPAQSMACEAPQGINEDLCGLTEYVGTAMGHTIGLVIANLDYSVHELLKIDPKYRSIGIIADRTGAGPQIFACDEAVKATNTEVCLIECPRDTEGGAGHGCLVVFGAEDVSDARRAVEVALSFVGKHFGDVYGNSAGHLEFQYTARASYCLEKAFGAVVGKAFGITVGAPSGIQLLRQLQSILFLSLHLVMVEHPSLTRLTSSSQEIQEQLDRLSLVQEKLVSSYLKL